jgi:hypothetical protein
MVQSPSVPTIPASVGYNTQTFTTSSFTTTNTDTLKSYQSGYQWYAFNFYSSTPTFANTKINSDGSISVGQGGNTYNANLSSAGSISASPHFVGTAFGGGAYIEVTASFNAQSASISTGWPAIWTGALENMRGINNQWPGQASGYLHYTENDIMEYFQGAFSAPLTTYGATNHDWYGVNSSGNYSDGTTVSAGSQAIFSNQNTYAMLWVPATSTTDGYINYYFNGQSVASKMYQQLTASDVPKPDGQPWAFGIIDQDHLAILLGSNNTYPVTVFSVQVWQANASANLHN